MNEDRWYNFTVAWTGAVLLFGLLLAVGREAIPDTLAVVRSNGYDDRLVATALLGGAVASWWAGVRFFGPVSASPAEQRWLIPDDSDGWLRSARRRALADWIIPALIVGSVVGLAVSMRWTGVASAGAAVALGLMAVAVVVAAAQRRDGGPLWMHWCAIASVSALLVAVWGVWWGAGVGVVAGLAALAQAARSRHRWLRAYRTVPRWNLTGAAQRRGAAGTALTLLDTEAVGAAKRGVTTRRFSVVLAQAPTLRLAALSTGRVAGVLLVRLVVGVALAVTLDDLLDPFAGMAAAAITAHFVTTVATRDLLAWFELPSLQRTLMIDRQRGARALSTPVVFATIALLVAVAVTLDPSSAELLVIALIPVVGTWSRMAAGELDDFTMVNTPFGLIPVEVVVKLLAGADATAIALIVLGFLA